MNSPSPRLVDALRKAGLDWIVPEWPAPADVGALVTTRRGGVSTGARATMNLGRGDVEDPAALAENRHRLQAFLPGPAVWLDQVHGTTVVTLGADEPSGPPWPIADAAVTRERALVCAVRTADCLPVLFAARDGSAVGIAHAGWRGLAGGVLEATIAALDRLGARPADLVAWLGPGIGPDAYEVGSEVRAAFCTSDPEIIACFAPQRDGKWRANLYALARRRLARAGISRIDGGGACTFSEADRFFSHRRDPGSGRMAALVWRVPLPSR